jgi:D-alanyl-D-alanine carboxypeptidase
MTRKARALGMSHTTYRNASGLPNSEQITTAFDLAILGRDIQARFPRYYRYFSLHEVAYRGQRIHNHNHLMDRVEGMDGIKTGYTAASGFNLLSSVKRDGHFLISVVMGGKSARSRDAYMERLIEAHIDDASGRGGAQVAGRDPDEEQAAPARPAPEPRVARPEPKPEPKVEPRATERNAQEPPRLQLAAVIADPRPRPAYVAAAPQQLHPEERVAAARPAVDGSTRKSNEAAGAATPGGMRWLTGAPPRPKLETRIEIKPKAQEAKPDEGLSVKGKESAPAKIATSKPAIPGWILQIGATDDADKAEALLKSAREKRASLLASAHGYTEAVHKGKDTLYRARFAGLEESRAEAACKALKSSGFSCFATRN